MLGSTKSIQANSHLWDEYSSSNVVLKFECFTLIISHYKVVLLQQNELRRIEKFCLHLYGIKVCVVFL